MADIIDQGDYTEIVCSSNEIYSKNIAGGETWSNILVDCTASGAGFTVDTGHNDNWTIQNLGVRGTNAHDTGGVIAYNGTGTIDNVYIGDGVPEYTGTTGMIGANHAGHVDITNCYIGHYSDNGIYNGGNAQQIDNEPYGGTVHVENCYFVDCNHAAFRYTVEGSTTQDCTIVVYGNVPADESGARNARGVWASPNDGTGEAAADQLDIVNYDIDTTGDYGNFAAGSDYVQFNVIDSEVLGGFDGNVTTSNVGSNPDTSVPAGVPTNAEAAASGESGGLDGEPLGEETFDHQDLTAYYSGDTDHYSIGEHQ